MLSLTAAMMLGLIPRLATGYSLKLCNGLNASQEHVRQSELTMHHFPDALLETNCVEIDPCTQQTSHGKALAAGEWHWRNDSALWLDGYEAELRSGGGGDEAYNWLSLEYARVPEGIHLRACEPDFNAYRLHRELVCAEGTEVSIDKRLGVPACPSSGAPWSLLDCMLSVEASPVVEILAYRAKDLHMAFGSLDWYTACSGDISAEAKHLCVVLETSYQLRVPLATPVSRTQLVRYDFSDGFGCLQASEVSAGHRLSRLEPPNLLVECPVIGNGSHASSADPLACDFTCDAGYTKVATGCVLGCMSAGNVSLTATACQDGQYASAMCSTGGVVYYHCQACAEVPGSSVAAWGATYSTVCQYMPCRAGTYGSGNKCFECPVNTVAPAQNMSTCLSCESASTGLYQPDTGQGECVPCFPSPPAVDCPPGTAMHASFAEIKSYFNRTDLEGRENMTAYCMRGYACLPCVPGSARRHGEPACSACARGTYQPHFQSSACFECALGQNTSRAGATSSTECVCQRGYE